MANTPEIHTFTSEFIPAANPSEQLMIVMHGLGDSLAGFLWMPPMLGLGRMNFLLLNAPEPYFMGYAWYELENPGPGVLRSRALLRDLFVELERQGWNSAHTMLFGFSQGCLMAVDFGLRYDQPLAGIVGVSGHVYGLEHLEAELHPQAREQAWLVTHGSHDELLPIDYTREQVEALQAAGVPIEWHEFSKGHTIDPHEEVPLVRNWIERHTA